MRLRLSALLAPALLLGACQMTVPFNTAPRPEGASKLIQLTGTVSYRQRIALPLDSVVTVSIVDVSLADAPATTIATTKFAAEGRQVPLPFTIDYDPARIVPNRRYGVQARIEDGAGKLMWITDTHFALSFAGEPIDLLVVQAH